MRATLAFVARGETPLGIVYETDAKIEPKVKIVGAFPDGSYPPVTYPVAATASGKAAAARYLNFLRDAGRKGDLRELRLQLSDQAGLVTNRRVLELSPQDWTAVQLSLRIAVVSTLVALPFGIAIATLLARKDFWGKALLDAIVHLPLVLPPVVTGYLLLITLRPPGADRRVSGRSFRHRVLVPLDRRGARLRRHGVSADGARDPTVDRGDRPAAGRCRRNARRQSGSGRLSPSRCRWRCPASSRA